MSQRLLFASASLLAVCIVPFASAGADSPVTLTVQADRPGARVSPTMWGIFFEDINYGADGGLYPERVKNRSFEFPDPLMGWTRLAGAGAASTVEVHDDALLGVNNRRFVRLTSDGAEGFGLANEGFFGMGVERGAEFIFSVYGRSVDAQPPGLAFEAVGADGKRLAAGSIKGIVLIY